ncbi:hypothetical protein Baya_13317 [Bagarius yarrelli]|uniref:Uncharacterized protein n=1 Tax=Bagarius yarrelli TaxID=175774 RepID=A0A556V5N8_BAGYA|nr:hypothetical protein Baya_13317 [Bagarius yarrelli]
MESTPFPTPASGKARIDTKGNLESLKVNLTPLQQGDQLPDRETEREKKGEVWGREEEGKRELEGSVGPLDPLISTAYSN